MTSKLLVVLTVLAISLVLGIDAYRHHGDRSSSEEHHGWRGRNSGWKNGWKHHDDDDDRHHHKGHFAHSTVGKIVIGVSVAAGVLIIATVSFIIYKYKCKKQTCPVEDEKSAPPPEYIEKPPINTVYNGWLENPTNSEINKANEAGVTERDFFSPPPPYMTPVPPADTNTPSVTAPPEPPSTPPPSY